MSITDVKNEANMLVLLQMNISSRNEEEGPEKFI